MLQNSKKFLALALTALLLSAPLTSTAAAAAPDLTSPMNLELRSDHRTPPRHNISHKGPAHNVKRSGVHHPPKHKVSPIHHKKPHRQPPPPPRHKRPHHQPPRHHNHHHHHSSNDKLIGGLIAGAVIGAVIANNS
ncbi:hypothetical protein [uncultured Phascolarctobacterium sp.]|uniref:hypothetical protein n=1 Tax=uncultured Phascolarctobacterium sp. TaxID=512296 RepID=UPI002605DDC1|nr:hypothetical protein [uncultured Phascolarctobacterium sp.]